MGGGIIGAMYDVVVVGAGPVGSYTASELSRRGYNVAVLEQSADAGVKVCCTGIISTDCYDTFGLQAPVLREARSAKFFAPSGEHIRLQRRATQAYIVDRAALDRSLKERAMRNGARYIFSCRAVEVQRGPDAVTVQAEHKAEPGSVEAGEEGTPKPFQAKALVLACGSHSALVERAGLGRLPARAIGAQAEVKVRGVDELEVYLDRELSSGFFAWLVPTEGERGLAGVLVQQEPQTALERLLEQLKTRGRITSDSGRWTYGTLPLGTPERTATDRVLTVGDAAGQGKPTTGGGIYYGLLCADMAVAAMEEAFAATDFSARQLSRYERSWRNRLGHELGAGYRARRIYSQLDNRQIDSLFERVRGDGLIRVVEESQDFSFDWHAGLVPKLMGHLVRVAPSALARAAVHRGN